MCMCVVAEGGFVRPLCALYVLERLLHVMNHSHFVNLLASALLLSGPEDAPASAQLHSPSDRRGSMDGRAADPALLVGRLSLDRIPCCLVWLP
jgi:hypothetical protein